MKSALIDFHILSKASFIIGSYYSSFSDESSFFNMIPKIIPLSKKLYKKTDYHCINYKIVNDVGYLNYDHNCIIKFLSN